MKKILIALALTTTVQAAAHAAGTAYAESCWAAQQAGKYRRGDRDWDEKNRDWLDSDSDDPYPDDLRDIDGRGYEDSRDAGSHPEDAR